MSDSLNKKENKLVKKNIEIQCSTTLDKLIAILAESEKEGDRAFFSPDISDE